MLRKINTIDFYLFHDRDLSLYDYELTKLENIENAKHLEIEWQRFKYLRFDQMTPSIEAIKTFEQTYVTCGLSNFNRRNFTVDFVTSGIFFQTVYLPAQILYIPRNKIYSIF